MIVSIIRRNCVQCFKVPINVWAFFVVCFLHSVQSFYLAIWGTQSCQVVRLLNFLRLFRDLSRSRRDSAGVVVVVAGVVSDLHKPNQMFAPHWVVIFMGRDTHLAKYDNYFHFLRTKINQSNYLDSGRFFYSSKRPGDHAPFLETPGNSGRLGRSGYNDR